jgi:hypothetical protein
MILSDVYDHAAQLRFFEPIASAAESSPNFTLFAAYMSGCFAPEAVFTCCNRVAADAVDTRSLALGEAGPDDFLALAP